MVRRMIALTVVSVTTHERRHQIGPEVQKLVEECWGAGDRAEAALGCRLEAE